MTISTGAFGSLLRSLSLDSFHIQAARAILNWSSVTLYRKQRSSHHTCDEIRTFFLRPTIHTSLRISFNNFCLFAFLQAASSSCSFFNMVYSFLPVDFYVLFFSASFLGSLFLHIMQVSAKCHLLSEGLDDCLSKIKLSPVIQLVHRLHRSLIYFMELTTMWNPII